MSSGCPIPVFIGDIVYGVNLKKNISIVKNDNIPSCDDLITEMTSIDTILPFHLDQYRNKNLLQLELVFRYLDFSNIRPLFLTHHFPQCI